MPKSKRRKRSKISMSGFFGVFKESSGKYRASIKIDGKCKYLGNYDTAKQAAKAHDKETIKLRRPFSKLNYPKKAPVGYTPIQQTLRSNNTVGCTEVYPKIGRSSMHKSTLIVKSYTLVPTTQPKKPPLPTIVLFSKPTNPPLY